MLKKIFRTIYFLNTLNFLDKISCAVRYASCGVWMYGFFGVRCAMCGAENFYLCVCGVRVWGACLFGMSQAWY